MTLSKSWVGEPITTAPLISMLSARGSCRGRQTQSSARTPARVSPKTLAAGYRGWLGGRTTLPYQYSNEPRFHANGDESRGDNAQPFVLGRRLVHTDFSMTAEQREQLRRRNDHRNPPFLEHAGRWGRVTSRPPVMRATFRTREAAAQSWRVSEQWVVFVGDENGNPLSGRKAKQLGDDLGASEGNARLADRRERGWSSVESVFTFEGVKPATYSVRMAPALVGMGLPKPSRRRTCLNVKIRTTLTGMESRGARVCERPRNGGTASRKIRLESKPCPGSSSGRCSTQHGHGSDDFARTDSDCGVPCDSCPDSGSELADEALEQLVAYVSSWASAPGVLSMVMRSGAASSSFERSR